MQSKCIICINGDRMKANPFNPKYPTNPKYFANREDAIRQFKKSLAYTINSKPPKLDNLAIVGDWGIGKTSLLKKFESIAGEKKEKVLTVTIPMPNSIENMEQFVQLLLDTTADTLRADKSIPETVREGILGWKVSQLKFLGVTISPKEKPQYSKSPVSLLRSSLIDLWSKYVEKQGIIAVVFLIDDVHYLVNAVKGAIYDLRAIFQDLPNYNCNYQLVITGTKTLFADLRGIAEPLVRFFDTLTLETFNLQNTKNAIFKPIKIENIPVTIHDSVIGEIHTKTQGHPFFIAFIMRELLDLKPRGEVTEEFFKKNYSKIFGRMRKEKFEQDFDLASHTEKKLLLKTAGAKKDTIAPKSIKGNYSYPLWERLCQKNLLIKAERGKYRLYHPLFKEYLKELK